MATGTSGAANSANNADQNLLNMEWRFHEWIMGVGGLNPDNVLDYFALSPFWDPECNNAVLRMQTQFNNLGEMKQRLSEMTGVEFALVHEKYPTLFIIQKQRRRSPSEVKPMAIYYVLQGSIYQCPDLQTLLSNRILGSLHHVESAFNEARVTTVFHPSTGYHWKTTQAEGPSTAPGASTPAIPTTQAVSGTNSAVAVSQDFRAAVDIAIFTVDNREKTKQQITGNTGPGAANATPGTDPKIKQEGGANASAANASTSSRNAPKAANKRRKKSEEASAAAASMGINTNVGAGNTQGRPPSAGVQSAGPATPGSAQPKRRKKTKTLDPK
ncbi:Mediator of RNA polymerase II transcription subunit 6 [Entomortierella chlamydospora]|uniref:Mediator of RNA polymerase II transcription subunit 6 n=1 Tax=Entomortierella chlamydospora TaxID=101097 RepID=A0A9P6MN40_9FUNG|nr:Mediator of RNA polymerase II transcription subunit 6 [Entomortierella chlamydospora]